MLKTLCNICYIDGKLQISWKNILGLSLLSVMSTILAIGRTDLISRAFNVISQGDGSDRLELVIVYLVGVSVALMIVKAIYRNYMERCKYQLQSELSMALMDRNLEMETWKNNATDTSSRYVVLDREVSKYADKVYSLLSSALTWAMMVVGYTIYLWTVSRIAVVVAVAAEAVVWRASVRIQQEMMEVNARRRGKYRKWFVFMQRTMENRALMKGGVNRQKYDRMYEEKAMDWNDASILGLRKLLTIDQLQNAGGLAMDLTLLLVGVVCLLRGSMDIGAVYSLMASTQQLKSEFRELPQMLEDIYVTQSHNNQIADFLRKNRFIEDQLSAKKEEIPQDCQLRGIVIRNLSFSYDGERYIIHNYCGCFEEGKMYAVTGDAGTGKTSLLMLLARLLVYSEGEITFWGQDLSAIERNRLWQEVSYVSKPCFIQGSAAENLAFGRENIDSSFLEQVKSMDAELMEHYFENENGDSLSAGEKQRLLIYRSICSDCRVLLLDEPFANLDHGMEETMISLLVEAKNRGKCIIFTTHRTEFLSFCDGVVRF